MDRQPHRQGQRLRTHHQLIVGLIGGVLGGWLFSLFGLAPVGTLGSLATSVIGAVVLLWIAAAISHKKIR